MTAVYDAESQQHFEELWQKVLEMVKDGQHLSWYQHLYEIKHMWVPVYLRRQFWAGMSTTQRSEGMNAYFDSYINSRTSLRAFVQKYDLALHNKWEKEMQEDFRCRELQPKLVTDCKFEKQFADKYTLCQFYLYQKEVKMLMTCCCDPVGSEHPILRFVVRDLTSQWAYPVQLNTDTSEYECICQYFEFRGVVCRHALCVCLQMGILTFPQKYVLARWCKDFIRSHVSQIVPDLPVIRGIKTYGRTYAAAHQILLGIVELGNTSERMSDVVINRLNSVKNELLHIYDIEVSSTNRTTISNDEHTSDDDTVQDPFLVRSKGRPRSNRLQGRTEKYRKRGRKAGKSKKNSNVDTNGVKDCGECMVSAGIQPELPMEAQYNTAATSDAEHMSGTPMQSATDLILQFESKVV